MFGFFGKAIANFEVEANGEVITTTRIFMIRMTAFGSTPIKISKAYFDIDNVGSDPDDAALLNAAFVSYVPNAPLSVPPAIIDGGGPGSSFNLTPGYTYLAKFYLAGEVRAWRYNSAAVLSPATRKYRISTFQPNLISMVGVNYNANNNSISSPSNQATATLNLNLNQFPNAKAVLLYESFISTLNFKPNTKVESVYIGECMNLSTINGKLPASAKWIGITQSLLTSVATFLSDAVNTEHLFFFRDANGIANPISTLSGSLDISHMTVLKEFAIAGNSSLTSIVLPSGKSDWRYFHMSSISASVRAALSSARIDEVIASSTIQVLRFISNSYSWSRTFVNADFSSALIYFWIYGNSITGNITLSTAKANITDFRTGNLVARTGQQQNSHPTVDITGLTGATLIDLTGSNISDLQLPVNTVCTSLYLWDNFLDVTVNTNLLSQINAMTALTSLQLSNTANSTQASYGQGSTNGLGSNPSFASLVNLTTLYVGGCKIVGTLTLPNVNKIVDLNVSRNPDLTGITNLTSHTSIALINIIDCTSLSISINTTYTRINQILARSTTISVLDLSNRPASQYLNLVIDSCTFSDGTITFPTSNLNLNASSRVIQIVSCASLTTMVNLEYVIVDGIFTSNRTFTVANCSVNQAFPLGVNSFIPNVINISGNGISQTNVDDSINNLYTNRTKFNVHLTAKSLNIGGSNAAPSGTYQAPTGFVLGSNDGTPASAKEQAYVLVNNYGWTITMN